MKINGTIEDNIWIINPELKVPDVFNKLYSTDKSKNKIDSSNIFWAIYLIYHPTSKFFNLPQQDKERLVNTDFLKQPKFDWSKYKKEINLFETLLLSPAKRQLIQWNRLLDEKSDFIKTIKYTEDTYDMLEKMLASNTKLYAEYDRISKTLEQEGEEGITKGGGEESASEKNLI